MAGWFRMYDEVLDDPKVQNLPDADFKAWVNLLCLARRNGGFLPDLADIAFALRIDNIAARSLVDRLAIGGLIDTLKGGPNGSRIAPHGWQKRQYKSDTSTERVKRFRNAAKAVSETPPETETETEIPEDKSSGAEVQIIDAEKTMWRQGRLYLVANGVPDSRAGSMLGKWKRDHGAEAVIVALGRAQREGAIDPVSFIEGCFRDRRADWGGGLSVPC